MGSAFIVVCSDANAVAVVDVSQDRSQRARVCSNRLVSDGRARA